MSCLHAEVLTAALNQERRAEEARKAEEERKQQEEYRAMLARLEAEAHQRAEEDRQKEINEALARMERDLQARSQAITAMQGGRVPGPSMAGAAPAVRVCEWCTVLLKDPEGCVLSEKSKARSCVLCQKARKACNWPLGQMGATTATGSRTEGSGKVVSEYLGATWQTHKTDYTSYYI